VNWLRQAWSVEPGADGTFRIVLSGAPPITACLCCGLPFRSERAARLVAEKVLAPPPPGAAQ
jgi:hypothetical protein